MEKTIKIVLGSEIRIHPELPPTFQSLQHASHNIFGVSNPSFQYTDDQSDLITFSTDHEYQLLIKTATKPLKFFIISSSKLAINSKQILSNHGFDPENGLEGSLLHHVSSSKHSSLKKHTKISNSSQIELIDSSKEHQRSYESVDEKKVSVLFETLKKNVSLENLEERKILCCLCSEHISGVVFICLDCEKHVMCVECERKDGRKHILIKAQMAEVNALLDKKIKRKGSSSLIRKSFVNFIDAEEANSETQSEICSTEKPKDENNKEGMKMEVKKRRKFGVTEEPASWSSRNPSSKSNTLPTNSHTHDFSPKKQTSEPNSPKESEMANKARPRSTKVELVSISRRKEKTDENLKKLKALGFTDEKENLAALIASDYKFKLAVDILSKSLN